MDSSSTSLLSLVPLLILIILPNSSSSSSATLSFDFYSASCPAVDMIVSNTVRTASSDDPSLPGKLLRLLFHDCFVDGCDGSVLLQGNATERSDPANGSLGGFQVIDSAKRVLEVFCPGTVSCADILALAARDAVAISGGPATQIPTGRRDGLVSSVVNVRPNIVDTSFTMSEMVRIFSSKGLSLDDLVILSGAHTIGSAHCGAFSDRKLNVIDSSLDANYAKDLIRKCPAGANNPSVTVANDPETSSVFDNQYYRNLLGHKGLFQSDSVLLEDERTSKLVRDLAADQEAFFERWSESFVKLTSVGVKTGEEGEIRASCSVSNSNMNRKK
ncbi:Peroxidase 18 [Linum grandiflorum]